MSAGDMNGGNGDGSEESDEEIAMDALNVSDSKNSNRQITGTKTVFEDYEQLDPILKTAQVLVSSRGVPAVVACPPRDPLLLLEDRKSVV